MAAREFLRDSGPQNELLRITESAADAIIKPQLCRPESAERSDVQRLVAETAETRTAADVDLSSCGSSSSTASKVLINSTNQSFRGTSLVYCLHVVEYGGGKKDPCSTRFNNVIVIDHLLLTVPLTPLQLDVACMDHWFHHVADCEAR